MRQVLWWQRWREGAKLVANLKRAARAGSLRDRTAITDAVSRYAIPPTQIVAVIT